MKKNKKAVKTKKVSVKKAPSVVPVEQSGKICPLGDRVLARPEDSADEKSPSGIIIPDTARKEKPERGIVVAVGPGKRADDGTINPIAVHVGDTIVFDKYGFTEVKIDDNDYYIVSESSILAIINK